MKQDVSKKKKILCIIASLLTLLCVFFVVWYFFLRDDTTKSNEIFYYPADYEANVFENQAYLDFQRELSYSAIGVEQLLSIEKNYDDASQEAKFFLDYFDAVIHGDYEKVKDFYCEDYFETDPRFTMQMIYEPRVHFHSVTEDEMDGKTVSFYNFTVEYKIFKNNGTFRKGVSSNTAIPQIYQLIKLDDGSYRIFRILEVEFVDE